jgi:ADP-heptose:LPS heptosyltransferase/lauroyl/myristoyl acyltransferase
LLPIIKVLGWVIAHSPELLLRVVAVVLGEAAFALPKRRRLILSNLHHAFPERAEKWRRQIGRESCRRMIETVLLSLATPYLREERIRKLARLSPELETYVRDLVRRPRPVVFGTVHLALWESQTWFTLLSPVRLPPFGIIFRPLDNAAANAFVKSTRERFGMRLLSRKEGFAEALKILRAAGCVGILFDQNAGMQGALTLLLDRVCSTTELPGLLASKFRAEVRTFYPRRTGFWRVEFVSTPIAHDGTSESVTLGLNRWLETELRADENLCASWLWAHARWRNQDIPQRRLRLEAKRNLLTVDLAARGLTALPRRTRIWIRVPNWLGDVVMALPLLRAIRASRPDAELTLVAKKQFLPLLSAWGVADHLHALPPRGAGYWWHFRQLRHEYVDVWILFTNSMRGDLEAWLSGTRQRFGIIRAGKPRPLLSHGYVMPADFDESRHHQLELWEDFLRHFGLNAPPDRAPIRGFAPSDLKFEISNPDSSGSAGSDLKSEISNSGSSGGPIGLIPGSENNPEKRWPVAYWRALIDALPEQRFVIFGTANDALIAEEVAADFEEARVENLAGKTDLPTFAASMASCRLLVTNDTGGMHLANAAGVPLVGLFGPTNPVRTGPVFSSPARVLQPPGCPPTGGASLSLLRPEQVAAEVRELLKTIPA